jgi:hypothetical protein
MQKLSPEMEAVFLEFPEHARKQQEHITPPQVDEVVTLEDFVAYMPMHNYLFIPTRESWPGASVNARIPPIVLRDAKGDPVLDDEGDEVEIKASQWLDRNKPVEQMTWAPGQPLLIKDRFISEGGWIDRPGATVFNLYRPPTLVPRNPKAAQRWLDHVHEVYPKDAGHIIPWLAHRVQRPHEKINHALFLGGDPGIGKDTMLEPVKRAVGPWNVSEISPQNLFNSRFNGYLKSVILRISEAHDLGDIDRFSFYEHMKTISAAPPDVLRCDEKNIREHAVLNICGVVITSNYKTTGIYLPANDRRHYVAWSDLKEGHFKEAYWIELWGWYNQGGDRDVAAYLAEFDLSGFNPKAPPLKTAAFWAVVDGNRAPEDSELADVLDGLGNPKVTTLRRVQNAATGDFETFLRDRRNRRQIPHRFEQCGYVPVRNDAANDGYWVIDKVRQPVYAKVELSLREQSRLARNLAEGKVEVEF